MNAILSVARTVNVSCKRYLSSVKFPSELVVPMNKDMIICWHPAQEFPYEYSLPLPEKEQIPSNSVLCIDEKEIVEAFRHKRKEFVIEELCKMTYTTKHRWYPRKWILRNRKAEPDRSYL